MRLCVLLLAALVVATAAVDPCKRQPFRGRCPSQNGETPKRSQFVLRYYLRNGECVSYPYGHCATDPSEPNLYRYKEECEDACISNAPANLGVPKSTTEDYQKEILAKEVKRVEFYATSTLNYGPPGSSRQTPPNVYTLPVTTTEAPVTTTHSYTYPRTSETTEPPRTQQPQTQQTTTDDPQPFEFHEETTESRPTTETSEQVDEQPFNFNEHDLGTPITTTFLSTTTETEYTSSTTQGTTSEASTTSETTTEAPTTTTETTTEAPRTTVEETTTAQATTTTEEVTTTEEHTTTVEDITTTTEFTTRMSSTSTSTTSTTTPATTTTTQRRQTTEASTTPSTTTTEDVPTTRSPRTECERRRASASSSSIRGGFVPVCTSAGDFERVQCETNGRQCFCVNTQGIEVPNSRTRDGSRPDCYSIQASRQISIKECVGASSPGPCHGSFERFFYNEDSQKCEQFTYSGCGGNGNNYESREACEGRCAPPPVGLPKCEVGEPLKTKIGVPVNCAKTDCPSGYRCSVVQHTSVCCPENNKAVGLQTNGRASRCALPKERGPCDKYELRFYFNADLNECKYFFWGGCEGNQNNFERVEDCESSCGVQKSGVTNRPNTEIRTTQGIRITPNGGKLNWEEEEEEVVQTTTPLAPAPTTARQTQRPPVPTTQRPTSPTTTTTTTRASRIQPTRAPAPIVAEESEEEEEEEVVQEEDDDQKEQPLHIQPPVPQQNTVLLGGSDDTDSVNRCLHPKDSGNCHGQFVRWFFDDEKKNCDVFTYTGCQGNGNNFASKEECMAICHKPEPTPSATPDFSQVCTNDVDAGECNGVFERFAFDAESQDCRAFVYGGCGGNGNNFATLSECRSRCVTATKKPPVSTCEADIDVGECAGVFSRFAFDKSINACRSFTYGGCGGNANNFATLQECTSKCVNRAVCPEPPACDTNRCQLVNDRSGCPFCSCPPVKQASPPGSLVSAPRESLPNCPPLDRSACHEPCMMFHNRQGCEECVCPQTAPTPPNVPTRQPTTQGLPQPPASSRRVEVGPPAPRATDAAPPAPTAAPRQFAVNTVEHQQVKTDQFNSLPRTIAAQIEEKCLQPVEPGPCKNFADRWYFNVDDGTCHPFKYGGCAGNRNHFFTQKECEVHCARFLSGSATSSALPPHANFSPTSSSESSEEESTTVETLEAFPAPKLHHRQFASPIFKPTGNSEQQNYGSDKIDSYSPPTPNSNLVGLSPPVHPTYFTYNGQDQGQRRAFSAGNQNIENRIEVGQQLELFGGVRQNFARGRFDGRQRFEVPTVPTTVIEQQNNQNLASSTPSEQLLKEVPSIQQRGRFDGRERLATPESSHRHLGDVISNTEPSGKIEETRVSQDGGLDSITEQLQKSEDSASKSPQSRFHPRTHTVDVPTPTPSENFGRANSDRSTTTSSTSRRSENARAAGVASLSRSLETPQSSETSTSLGRPQPLPTIQPHYFDPRVNNQGSIRVTSQQARAPESTIIGRPVTNFQQQSVGSDSSRFPHRFVTTTTAPLRNGAQQETKTPWFQSTSAPWWLRSPAPAAAPIVTKKRPELKIEKLEKDGSPARFNFDPSRYTFYNGDYFGPTIPGIRINQTQGLFVQGGRGAEGDENEAQEAFEQFRQLSKGFQEQANKFLEQEKKAGRTPQQGSFIIGSVKVGGEESKKGIHDDEDDESLEVEDEHRSRPRIHGVPIQPTVPLVVPTYSSPVPAVRGPTGKIEGLETIGSHQEPHPPAPSTMIVPRLPSARIQGFQVTRPSTTTTTTNAPTPSTTQPRELPTQPETSEEIQESEDVQPLPVIKEVHEEQTAGKNVQVVDLEKVNAPKAQAATEDFDRDMMLGSGEGSGVSSEFEMASEEEEEVTERRPLPSKEEDNAETETPASVTPETTTETTSKIVPTTETVTTTTDEPSTARAAVPTSSEFKTTSEEVTTSADVVSTSEEATTTTPLKKIQIRPRVFSTTTTTTASPTTTSSVPTTSVHSTSFRSSLSSESSSSSHTPREPETITSSESGEVVSDFAFNSDEEHDKNTEIIETSPDTVRAAGSKTLSAVKAVETKHHKEVEQQSQENNGINRKMESINIDLPEHTETLAPTPVTITTTAAAPTTTTTLGNTPQPHFEPKFDGRVVCAMPPDAGVCTNFSPRWFFNSQTGQCEQFSYGSCGGNENNFFDRNVCERKCMPHHVILAQVPDRCSYDKDSGSGKGYNVKWYFNMKNLRCEQFVFEGLGGNTNQFETLSECERICTPSGPKTPTLPPQPVHEVPEIISTLPIGAPGSQRPVVQTPTTTFATTTQFDSQEIYDDDDDEEPIIVPEVNNEMPPLSPASTFGNINDNVELRLPEIVQTVQTSFAPTRPSTTPVSTTQAPTTSSPTTTVQATVSQTAPASSVAPVAPVASVNPVVPVATAAPVVAVARPVATVPVPVLLPETPEVPEVVVPDQTLLISPVASVGPVAPQPTVPAAPTASTPLPPSLEPRPPAAFAAKTVVQMPTYKADPVVGREHIPTANDGQPLVAPSPKETINYQTGQVNTPTPKQAGIKSFDGTQDAKLSAELFNKAGPTTSINGMPACANGRTEKRYSDGRPVMCLPGKNQCPDGSSCYFNGLDFFCCPEEEDPYDKHAFGGYGGEETKNGYKVFGALNIRRLMDEVPLRLKRQANVNFNIDSVVAPLRFDAEKPRQVSRALRMKSSPAVPRHGANPLCIQPVVKGSCQEAHLRYYYDRVTDICRLFEYSGCDGNANNFGSLEDCQRLCVLNVQNIKNGQIATTTAAPMINLEEEEKLAPGQCPGGRAPLGGSSPVLCGNSTESIGCPTSYYCRRGPPDVCCPGTDPKLMQPEEIVKDVGRGVVKNESHMPRGFNRQIFLSTPKYMCPDAADPLMLENGEPMLCGSGFDGVKMCPKGYYCAIDSARNSRLCCPLYGDAQRIAPEEVFAPRLASNTETTTARLAEDVNVEEQEEEEEEEEGEDFVAHLKVKPDRPGNVLEDLVKDSTDLTEEGEVSIDLGNQDKIEEEEVTTTTEKMMVQDKSVCQIKPAEGRPCNESETPTRTNLQYFFSPKHNRCKLFFFQGCGGNLNRFEKKSDCEALCL